MYWSDLGFGEAPFISGGGVVCYETGELSDRERLRLGFCHRFLPSYS